jgi:photosystem I reaction center subunit XII|uniref:Photosystem I reaction center subunit XII n=1 Tax=Eustigmatophyceae sp. Chic 10/23 P-6w TaxID=1446905 RepID=A0A3R5U4E4_9STRA|nr:photosystem I reaction center subunit M [Eustigmatophyceae sp. Chic 10/23 P-6w]QAA11627.1 photosystem I reaction center subunit M [Eustigmatophyceae sp. Chic 10/23 P-6w]
MLTFVQVATALLTSVFCGFLAYRLGIALYS